MIWKFIKQNNKILSVALGLFLISMSTLVFLGEHKGSGFSHELKASVIDSKSIIPESIKDEEIKYRTILHNSTNPVLALNLDGTIGFVSNEFLEKLGYESQDVQGKSFFLFLQQEDLPTFMNAYGDILKNEAPVSAIGPYRLKMKDDVYAYHIGYVAPFMENGKMTKILLVTKSIEDKMRESEEVNKTAKENNKTKEKNPLNVLPPPQSNPTHIEDTQLLVDKSTHLRESSRR